MILIIYKAILNKNQPFLNQFKIYYNFIQITQTYLQKLFYFQNQKFGIFNIKN